MYKRLVSKANCLDRECQTADWAAGHKLKCGKFITSALPVANLKTPETALFGSITGNRKRSPQLVRLILRLDLNQDIDWIVQATPQRTYSLVLAHEPTKRLFRAAREKVVVEADLELTIHLCHFVVWFLRSNRMDIDDGDGPAAIDVECMVDRMKAELSVTDLRRAMMIMQDRQRADEMFRP